MEIGTRVPRGAGLAALALAAANLFVPAPPALAQVQTGAVSGSITDPGGARLGFVQVTVEGTRLGTISDAGGNYRLENVPAGSQTVVAQLIGYKPGRATVAVASGATATQDFTLEQDQLDLEAIVVTGTRTPTRKLETSTAITTFSAGEIEKQAPRSTADLLESVPGFYVESSGGEVNNNLFVRGLPQDGSYRYVVMLENEIMAFDGNDLFFLGADNLIRIDENVERIEAVRGGNSALFGTNAPGGLVNIIDKTGGPEVAGAVKASVGTDGLTRYDVNVNGPLAEDWRFSLGGHYRYDDGIRDPGFPAARGGQIKANVTRLFDRGYVRVFAKYVNDKNVFYLPVPVLAEPTGDESPQGSPVIRLSSEEFAPGFPSDGTLTTNDANFARIPLPQGNGEFSLPLEDGIAQTGGSVTGDLRFDFGGGWSIQNTLRAMNLNHENNAMPPGQAVPVSEFLDPFLDDAGPGATADVTFVDTGDPFNTSNGLVQNATLWHVERPISNVSNQLLLRNTTVAGSTTHNITLGSYFGFYTADHLWMFNNLLTNVQNAPRLLNVSIRDAGGNVIRQVTENGFTSYLSLFVNATANATLFSFFAGDEVQVGERWRFDFGARFERDEYEANQENTEPFDLGGPSDADDDVNWGNRTFTRRQVDFNEWAASVGVNYLINEQVSVYGRGSRGYKMPLLDQYATGTFPDTAETLWQAEGGVKVSTPTFGLSALAYWVQLENFPSQDARIDPVTGDPVFVTAIVGEARTVGAEVEGVVSPYPGVRLTGRATLQEHEYTSFLEGGRDLSGNWVRRLPKVLFGLGAEYTGSGFAIGGDYSFVGKRFSNNPNTVELPEYGHVGAHASYRIPGQGLTFMAAAQNLLDGEGLTEGDPRFDESGAPTGLGNARPILPRRFVFSVRYDF